MFKKLFLSAILSLALIGIASATSFTGTISGVRPVISTDGSGTTTVYVYTGTATACTNAGWYSFQYAANGAGPGSAWFAQVMDAQLTQESITVYGTGSCAGGIETVQFIQSN